MTPEEVFARLRDIHLPDAGTAAPPTLDLRPIIAFALLVAAVVLFRLLLTVWRRRAALSRTDRIVPLPARRDALARLLSTSPRRRPADDPPAVLFDPPGTVTSGEVAGLRRWVARRLG